jgi:RHS repeat-associated protein
VLSLEGNSFEYDVLNTTTTSTVAGVRRMHLYNAGGERVASVTMSGTVPMRWDWTLRDTANRPLRRLSFQGSIWRWEEDYIYAGGKLIAAAVPTPEKILHFHADHLGTPRLITGNGGARVSEHDYFPFGREVPATTQEPSAVPPFSEALKFTGHERDAGTLDYMHARYYAPYLGRFLSVDPYLDGEKTMRNPQMWNRYAYVTNNPLRYTDPTGKSLWETLFRVVRYIGREEKVVARVKAISKSKAMEGIERGIKVAREEKATSIAVVTESKQARNTVGKQLAESGKIRPPERSGIWPEHVNPADGPNADIHVQTVDATKSAGFGKSLGVGLLAIIGANTMAANANADATSGEVASAFIWDTAKAIDPIFLTDVIEHVTGANGYAEENPPE